MNAHYIQAYSCEKPIIISTSPKSKNEELFWEMVLQNNVKYVVGLENDYHLTLHLTEDDLSPTLGNIEIVVKQINKRFQNSHYSLNVSSDNQKFLSISYVAVQSSSSSNSFSVSIWEKVWEDRTTSMKENPESTALLFCSDGCKQSDIFLTFMTSMNQIEKENRLDILRIVKDLRDYRPSLLNDLESYKKCLELIKDYLNLFSEKNNQFIYENI